MRSLQWHFVDVVIVFVRIVVAAVAAVFLGVGL